MIVTVISRRSATAFTATGGSAMDGSIGMDCQSGVLSMKGAPAWFSNKERNINFSEDAQLIIQHAVHGGISMAATPSS